MNRAGQAAGTIATAYAGYQTFNAGAGATVLSGGVLTKVGVASAAVAVYTVGGATVNAVKIATTPMRMSSSDNTQKSGGEEKPKKERTVEGARVQRENIEQAQKVHRKAGRRDRIGSIEKSKQNEKNELKKIKSSKDVEDPR